MIIRVPTWQEKEQRGSASGVELAARALASCFTCDGPETASSPESE